MNAGYQRTSHVDKVSRDVMAHVARIRMSVTDFETANRCAIILLRAINAQAFLLSHAYNKARLRNTKIVIATGSADIMFNALF